MKLRSLSENTVLILFEQEINHSVFQQVSQCTKKIEADLSDYVIDIVPSYASIQILFNITKISSEQFSTLLDKVMKDANAAVVDERSAKIIEIPVYYGLEVALDIEDIARSANISIDEVISLHSSVTYDVYAIGFAPGFAYLGNVDKQIAMPRKETPRKKIRQGSLGIADQQTAIYPSDSPGGWQIVGRTPLSMIDYNEEKLTQFEVGDRVKFYSISQPEYLSMGGTL